MEKKLKVFLMAALAMLAMAFPLSVAAADDDNLNEYDEYKFGKEYEADCDLGKDDPDAGELRYEYDDDGNVTGIFLETIMETHYTTPSWTGANAYSKISAMSIESRDPKYLAGLIGFDPKAQFKTTYTPASSAEPFKGGMWKGTGIVPLTAAISFFDLNVGNDLETGNYGAYQRIEFSPGVDARSMAKSINWKTSGASSRFTPKALGIANLPTWLYFPLTWAPRYTRWSAEDPNAIYVLIRGVNYKNFTEWQKLQMTTHPLVLAGFIGIATIGLGNISGHAAGHLDIELESYEGNLSSNELVKLGYNQISNPEFFRGADDSPNKVLTKGTLPPDPANRLEWAFYTLDKEVMLAPKDSILRQNVGVQGAYFVKNKVKDNVVENNAIPSWSSYFSPIDRNREESNYLSKENWNLNPLKSFNTESQLDENGNYLPTEFQEVPAENYTKILPGTEFKERTLNLSHKDLLMTYGELNNPAFGEKGGQENRFMRVIDFFNKTDITNDASRQITMRQSTLDENYAETDDISELMKHLNESWPVFFNGSATPSNGGAVGPINSATLNVIQHFEPPVIKLKANENSTELKLREVGISKGTVSSVESNTVKIQISIDGGEYTDWSTIETANQLGDEKPFEFPSLLFNDVTDIGTHTITYRAIDEFGLKSEPVTQTIKVIANDYQVRIHYVDNANQDITTSKTLDISDVDLSMNTYSVVLQNYVYSNASWNFQYSTLNDDTTQYQLTETIELKLSQLKADQTDIYYHYLASTPDFELPNAIKFGTQKITFTEQDYFPEQIDGELVVTNNTNRNDWTLNVQGTALEDKNLSHVLNGSLNYYKNGQSSGIIEDSLIVYNAATDGDASTGLVLSDLWTLSSDLESVPKEKLNGFSVNARGGSKQGNYQATLNWTFVSGVQ